MLFLGVLHSLVQLPKDLYSWGITNCKQSLVVPFAQTSESPIICKYEKLGIVTNNVIRKVKGVYPSITTEEEQKITELLAPWVQQDAWAEKKHFSLAINGYEATTKLSFFVYISLFNDAVKQPANSITFHTLILKKEKEDKVIRSFCAITDFEIVNEEITNAHTNLKREEITREMIEAVVPAVAPLAFDSTVLLKDKSFVAPVMKHIKTHIQKYITIEDYIDLDEALRALLVGKADFNAIATAVRKRCLITPTPSPAPTPYPTLEPVPEEDVDMPSKQPRRYRRNHRNGHPRM